MSAGEDAIMLAGAEAGAAVCQVLLGEGVPPTQEQRDQIIVELRSYRSKIVKGTLKDLLELMGLPGYQGPFTLAVTPGSTCDSRFQAHYTPTGGGNAEFSGHPVLN